MNSADDGRLRGIGFYEGIKSPEGKILVRYRAPDFEPSQWGTERLDWGVLSPECQRLANLLLNDVGCDNWPWSGMREQFAAMVVAKLPCDRKWRLWCSEISHFREKIHREALAGRHWPECDYQ
jgi:hypothetical protein